MKFPLNTALIRKFVFTYWPHFLLLACEITLALWTLHRGFPYLHIAPKEKDKSWWTVLGPYVTTVAGLFGGSVALWTYNRSHKQKQEHFDRDAQKKQEFFERQTLDAQFADVLNRLSNKDSAMIRANAALRLSDMASEHTRELHSRACSQLSEMLHMEEQQAVRDEVVKAVYNMATIAEGHDPLPLHILIRNLADANRSAKKAFIDALAEFECFKREDAQALESVPALAPLAFESNVTKLCLENIRRDPKYIAAFAYHKAIRDAGTNEAEQERDKYLHTNLRLRSAILVDTVNSLAAALTRLPMMFNVPEELEELELWKRPFPLSLIGCFLTGAILTNANLQDADLKFAHLEGAYLGYTGLQGADLRHVYLQAAHLDFTKFVGANLAHAQIQKALMFDANFRGADMSGVQLQDAYAPHSRLQNACLFSADLHGAILSGFFIERTMLAGATILYQGDSIEKLRMHWQEVEWWKANFYRSEIGEKLSTGKDDTLWDLFAEAFPEDAAKVSITGNLQEANGQ